MLGISRHDAGNGSARSQSWNAGVEVEGDVKQPRRDAAGEIEKQVADVPEVIFDVIAEDPKEEHVPEDMGKAGMEEHAGYNRDERSLQAGVPGEKLRHADRNGCVGHQKSGLRMRRQSQFVDK